MTSPVPIYNPRTSSADTLEAIFVGREHIALEILDDLRLQVSSESRQHWIITGPRGIGKTHLSAVIYHRVQADNNLSAAYLPIWFPETAAYEVVSATSFLAYIAEECIEVLGNIDIQAKDRLSGDIDRILSEHIDAFDELRESLKRISNKVNRILLIQIENFDAILSGFAPKQRKRETLRLRSLLLHDSEFLLICTTPTDQLKELTDPAKPLYAHLRTRRLRPLDEKEVGQLVDNLSNVHEGTRIKCRPEDDALRKKVLHRLTNGIPRSVIMACRVAAGAVGIREMIGDFHDFLDRQTAYFEARLRELASRERKIVTTMSLATENLTIKEIASISHLPSRSLSTLISRLIELGYVENVDGSTGKGSRYSIVDPLFRLWYQYRRGKRTIGPLVRFVALWMGEEDLRRARIELIEACSSEETPVLSRELSQLALHNVEAAIEYRISETGKKDWLLLTKSGASFRSDLDVSASTQEDRQSKTSIALKKIRPLLKKARSQLKAGHFTAGIRKCDEAIRMLQNSESEAEAEQLPRAYFLKAQGLSSAERIDEAIQVYDLALDASKSLAKKNKVVLIAKILIKKGIALEKAGRTKESLELYDEVVSSYADVNDPYLEELMAKALILKSMLLDQNGQIEESIKTASELIFQFRSSNQESIFEIVSLAMAKKGAYLFWTEQFDEGIPLIREMIESFLDRDEDVIKKMVVISMYNLAQAYEQRDSLEESLLVEDELINRFSSDSDSFFKEHTADAYLRKSRLLDRLGQSSQSQKVIDSLIHRYGKSKQIEILRIVVQAHLAKVMELNNEQTVGKCISHCSQVEREFEKIDDPELSYYLSLVKATKCSALTINGEALEGARVFDSISAQLDPNVEESLLGLVTAALAAEASSLERKGDRENAIVVYDNIIRHTLHREGSKLDEVCGYALLRKGIILRHADTVSLGFRRLPKNPQVVSRELINETENLLVLFDPEQVLSWLSDFGKKLDDVNLVRELELNKTVAELVHLTRTSTGLPEDSDPRKKLARRRARIPPEARSTIEEAVEKILKSKQSKTLHEP